MPKTAGKIPIEPDTPPPGWQEDAEHASTGTQYTPEMTSRPARRRKRSRSPSLEWLPSTGSHRNQQTNDAVRRPDTERSGQTAQDDKADDELKKVRVEEALLKPQLPLAKPKPKKRPTPLSSQPASEQNREAATPEKTSWPLDPSWPPAPADPAKPAPRSASLDKPFAEILQLRSDKSHTTTDAAESLQPPAAPRSSAARETKQSRPPGPRRSKSIWFDTTEPSEMAAALRPKKRASRRQMFRTVLLISAANRAAEAQQDAADTSQCRRSRQPYKRDCTDRLPWQHLTAVTLPLSCSHAPFWPRPMTSMLESPGRVSQHKRARHRARSETSAAPFHHRFCRRRPGVFPAPAALSSGSSLPVATRKLVHPGRGRLEPMIPEDRLAYWQVGILALHQSLLDLRLHISGLAEPPRTATSIPAGRHSRSIVYPGHYQQLSPGLSSTLAAGRATFDPANCRLREPYLQRSQGWVDCYQDPQNCAICHQRVPQAAFPRLTPVERWLWQLGCLDHLPMMLGYESAQAAIYCRDPRQCCNNTGTEQDQQVASASSHLTSELPKAADAATAQSRSNCIHTAPGPGVSQTLATRHRGRNSPLPRVATFASAFPWLPRLVLGPFSPTTWATRAAWAVVDIMNNGPERPLGSLSSHLLDFTLETKCPEKPVGPPHWTWTV